MTFAPAIQAPLRLLIEQLDDGAKPVAQIWRELGYAARARGHFQPSYESVRRIVRLARLRAKRALIVSAELLWRTRHRKQIVLALTPRAGASAARNPCGTASPRGAP